MTYDFIVVGGGSSGAVLAARLPTQRALYAACRALGFPDVSDHNDPSDTGIGPGPTNLRDRICISTAIAYLLPARNRANLTIRAGWLVDKVAATR
jgi:choline dehydrogenase